MTIGVAIVTHNNSRDIVQCVASIRATGLETIVIIDSASEDTTVQEIARLGVMFQEVNTNRGFGYCANKAANLLNTEYVLFINPDACILPGSIVRLKQTLQEHPRAGIVGMLLCDFAGVPEGMAFGDEPNLFTLVARHFFKKKLGSNPFCVDWVSGGAFAIQKKVFEHIGGFDENFFMYWEDIDLCRRVREKGYVVLMDPNARVVHARGGSNMDNDEKIKIYGQSADRYYKKHYSSTIWRLQRFLRKMYKA